MLQPKDVMSAQYYPGNVPEADFLAESKRPGDKQVLTLAAEKSSLPNN